MGKYNITKKVMSEYFSLYPSNTERFDNWIDEKIKLSIKKKVSEYQPNKRKFLDFVYMTPEEYIKLENIIWEKLLNQYIDKLNNYIGSTWKNYVSHYFTILNWTRREWVKYTKEEIEAKESVNELIYKPLTEEEKEDIKQKMKNLKSNFNINNM